MNTLLEPFGYGFFRHALMVSVLAGGLCGLVGVYVVLRGMSYIGHGLSHAIFGGAVAGVALLGGGAGASLGLGFYLGAAVFGVGAALLINRIARRRTIGADAAIGVVTSAAFAFGIAIISTQDGLPGERRGAALRERARASRWSTSSWSRRSRRSPSRSPCSCGTGSCCSPPSTPRSPRSPG